MDWPIPVRTLLRRLFCGICRAGLFASAVGSLQDRQEGFDRGTICRHVFTNVGQQHLTPSSDHICGRMGEHRPNVEEIHRLKRWVQNDWKWYLFDLVFGCGLCFADELIEVLNVTRRLDKP